MNAAKAMLAVSCLIALPLAAAAQEAPMPQPTAEHEVLGTWVGEWSGEGEMKPGPFGEGGPMTWSEQCTWFEGGRFHVICRSQGSGFMGPVTGLGIIGYNPGKQVYTQYGVDSNGWSAYAEGTRSGDTWVFRSQEVMGDTVYQTRATMTMTSPDTLTFAWEISEDGENWTLLMDGTSSRK